jgi:hypothetical protein
MPRDLGERFVEKHGAYEHHVDLENWKMTAGEKTISIPKWLRKPELWDYPYMENEGAKLRATMIRLADVNDAATFTPKQREVTVGRLFEKLGWKAVFHGRYPKVKAKLADRG